MKSVPRSQFYNFLFLIVYHFFALSLRVFDIKKYCTFYAMAKFKAKKDSFAFTYKKNGLDPVCVHFGSVILFQS